MGIANTEYTNTQGSIILPPGAIIPYASLNNYTNSVTPSGFLYCDGYWYDPSNNLYANLFSQIGFTYGTVDVNNGYVPNTSTEITVNYFRTPNLMNQNQIYSFTNQYTSESRTVAPENYDVSGNPLYTTIGGTEISVGSIGHVFSTNQISISINNMPSHNHLISAFNNSGATSGGTNYVAESPGNGSFFSTTSEGYGEDLTLPTTPSFVMNYLIKL